MIIENKSYSQAHMKHYKNVWYHKESIKKFHERNIIKIFSNNNVIQVETNKYKSIKTQKLKPTQNYEILSEKNTKKSQNF